ncbi:Gfo/Idh/MocA family protein [Kutzneria chonburiensis]|uniref:Gfo/Idh/MocA family protein n=1 Tax=Kutzneria chonburiensis TaxID=1483604 RepID=A0ABV6MN03_9PSEU|nr:Gfo/Idh/MocA family oxidoreductase [Kutzneria chonburiensis]
MADVPSVALIGMHGHGRVHLDGLLDRDRAGRLVLCGVADVREPAQDVLAGRMFDTDAGRLLDRARADIVVITSPAHTHLALAERAMELGSHVLLEKPPVTSLADHDRLAAVAARTRRHCQVGFQAFGSSVVQELVRRSRSGELGSVQRVSVVGCWSRDADYFTRSHWAGHRAVDGVVVADGALINPFAHGVALALRLAAPRPDVSVRVQAEAYHAYPIECDDTMSARIEPAGGVPITAAVTLCARHEFEPYVRVFGSQGHATIWYTEDRARIEVGGRVDELAGDRVALIDDLVANLSNDSAVLCSPLSDTRSFTSVLEAVVAGPAAQPIPPDQLRITPAGRTIPGIEDAVVTAGERGVPFSELGLPWAVEECR